MASVAELVATLMTHGTTRESRHGVTLHEAHVPSVRYEVDFADDFVSDGWSQFDTDQDAHYFGVWMNHRRMMVLSYTEGDWSLAACSSREQYVAEVNRCIEFYGEGRIALAIGADGSTTSYHQDREAILAAAQEGG